MAKTQPAETPRLKLKQAEVNATGQVTRVNSNQSLLELMAGTVWIKDKDLSAPPSIVDGEGYIIASGASGAWTGKATQIAWGINAAWVYVVPWYGLTVEVEDENGRYRWNGSAWKVFTQVITKTADFTAAFSEATTYLIDATAGNVVATLPTAASANHRGFTFLRTDGTGNTVTLDGASSETINGSTTHSLASQYAKAKIESNGSAWFITG